jgi:hypothetical protein
VLAMASSPSQTFLGKLFRRDPETSTRDVRVTQSSAAIAQDHFISSITCFK